MVARVDPGFASYHPAPSSTGQLLSCLPLLQPLPRHWVALLPALGSWWLSPRLPFALWLQIYHEAPTTVGFCSAALAHRQGRFVLSWRHGYERGKKRNASESCHSNVLRKREKAQIIRRIRFGGFDSAGPRFSARNGTLKAPRRSGNRICGTTRHCGVNTGFVAEKESNPCPQQQPPWEPEGDCCFSKSCSTSTAHLLGSKPTEYPNIICTLEVGQIDPAKLVGILMGSPPKLPLWSALALGQDCLDGITGQTRHAGPPSENTLSPEFWIWKPTQPTFPSAAFLNYDCLRRLAHWVMLGETSGVNKRQNCDRVRGRGSG